MSDARNDDHVKVAVRIRPLITSEIEKGCQNCLNVIDGEQQIHIQSADKAFTFNYVFPADSTQEGFYNTAIKDMVKNVFEGYNVTILAYGQTGSGKTHSMGTNYVENDSNVGVIPRAINDIFKCIEEKLDWEFTVKVAFMELYKEQLYDLLAKKPRNQCVVDIREDLKGIKMFGLTEVQVRNTSDTLQCLTEGSVNRATGSTAMNIQSSRSHAIFTLSINQQKKNDPTTAKFAKFHLVDLAGSERSKKTQATGERFKEGVNINKGLLALGNVISQLGEGGSSSYIGYRDSKLTRLLQDSLGGNSVTLMIACVSPADYNLDETISTLRYADRAKKIKNKPIVNQDERVAEILNLKRIIQELKSTVYEKGGGFCPPEHLDLQEKNQVLQRKVRILTDRLNANLIKIVHMHEQADLTEQALEQTKKRIDSVLEDCEKLLEYFNNDPTDVDTFKSKLQNICFQITALQKDQKKTDNELVNRELSVESSFNSQETLEFTNSSNADEISINNETFDIDEKHEEHTLQQVQCLDEVQNINKQLAIKEELVANLIKHSPQIIEYQKELEDMESEIRNLLKEKEDLLAALKSAQMNNASSKLAENRRKKVQELEKKIAELSRKCLEQTRTIKNKEKSDVQIKNLSNEITALKQNKIKLIRNMRSEAEKFSKWKRAKEQELYRLKDQGRKQLNKISKLQVEHDRQKNVYKRKLEEAQSINKRLKEALDLQKKAAQRREKAGNSKDSIELWVTQELNVLLSTVEAECTLERLKQDKAYFATQLADLQLQDSNISSQENKKAIEELVEYIDSRNNQIQNLEKDIKESNQENRSKTRWHLISSMNDAKLALKTLFETAATNGKKYHLLKHEYNDLVDKYEKIKERKAENESKLDLIAELTNSGTGPKLDQEQQSKEKIQFLENEIVLYKKQIEDLQKKILFEKDDNVVEKRMKLKPKMKVMESVFTDSFNLTDESMIEEDNEENDPDWKKTPLYTRIKKLENIPKNVRESKAGLKRSSNGEIKCSCKTQCSSRLCSCRKNDVACENCNCNPNICQNKSSDMTRRTLFVDSRLEPDLSEIELKKSKMLEQSSEA